MIRSLGGLRNKSREKNKLFHFDQECDRIVIGIRRDWQVKQRGEGQRERKLRELQQHSTVRGGQGTEKER